VGLVGEGGGSGGLRYGELAGGELGCQFDGSLGSWRLHGQER
jgi:hypothetical protein